MNLKLGAFSKFHVPFLCLFCLAMTARFSSSHFSILFSPKRAHIAAALDRVFLPLHPETVGSSLPLKSQLSSLLHISLAWHGNG
jgi:hypothetical protein